MDKHSLKRDLVVGRRAVEAALKGKRRVHEVWLTPALKQQPLGQKIINLAQQQKITLKQASRQELDFVSKGINHQGILAQVDAFTYLTLSEAERALKAVSRATVVLLDGVTDPQNLGAIARSCLAFNVNFIFLPKRRTALITPAVVKAAAGATEYLSFVQSNLASAVEHLKTLGFWLYAATPEAKLSLKAVKFAPKSGLIFGAEGKGLSQLLRKKVDYLFSIPIDSRVGSLNVAATVAITLACGERGV